MRVLIVEDEDAIAEPLAEGLRREGFDVERAATGAEALAAAEPDIVLLDLRLPDMDGLDVCRQLRARSERADHHRHGARRGGRPRRRARARRRRLRRQAVRAARADRPHPRRHRRGRTAPDGRSPLRVGGLEVDERTRRAALDGDELDLTPKEFDAAGRARPRSRAPRCSRRRLLEEVWETSWYGSYEDDRRPRRGAAPQARRSRLDRDGPRCRLPPARRDAPAAPRLSRPDALRARSRSRSRSASRTGRTERRDLETKVEHDATTLASIAQDALRRPARRRPSCVAARSPTATRARHRRPGACRRPARASPLVDTSAARAPAGELRLPTRDRRRAARQRSPRAPATRATLGTRTCSTSRCRSPPAAGPRRRAHHVSDVGRRRADQRATGSSSPRSQQSCSRVAALVGIAARDVRDPAAAATRARRRGGRRGDLAARAPEDEGPPEVRSLAARLQRDRRASSRQLAAVAERVRRRRSHQLRTPLTALRLRLENLERDVAPQARRGARRRARGGRRGSRRSSTACSRSPAPTPGAGPPGRVDVDAVVAERARRLGRRSR